MLSFSKARKQNLWLDTSLTEPNKLGYPYIFAFEKEIVLDFNNFEVLNSVLDDVMREGARKLVIDMGNVNYISVNALAVLTAKNEEFKSGKGEIVLANLKPKMVEIFRLLGFDKIFRIFNRVEEATELFNVR